VWCELSISTESWREAYKVGLGRGSSYSIGGRVIGGDNWSYRTLKERQRNFSPQLAGGTEMTHNPK